MGDQLAKDQIDFPEMDELDESDRLVLNIEGFEGPLDVFIASPVLSCQRDAGALAMAFQKDVGSMELERRLTAEAVEVLKQMDALEKRKPGSPTLIP